MKTKILRSLFTNPLIQLRQTTSVFVVAFGLACFGLSTTVQAVSPAPDGGYPGNNTAEGANALFNLTTGFSNTANGYQALFTNSSGSGNTATGYNALFSNNGSSNTADGSGALHSNTGSFNTAIGNDALNHNTTSEDNTAVGYQALFQNKSSTFGNGNTAIGFQALLSNSSGTFNIALGYQAGHKLTTGFSNIDIGNDGVAGESDTIRIGTAGTQTAAFIAGINSAMISGTPVVVDSSGQLGVAPSSARFKEAIKPMDNASEAILALKPVTFRYKNELDPDKIPQFGLVAEEVEKVNPDLVARDAEGKVYTVRYEAVNAMLLNEFLKARRQIDAQQKEIEALTAGLQKVSAQLELNQRAPQTVVNP
jgi:hypothetical protein